MAPTVYERLHDDIVTGVYKPGSQLNEAFLAEQHEVSRTPVREALLQLFGEGLIQKSDNGRGYAVATRRPEEILEIYDVRILLEEAAARRAAMNRTELDVSKLRRLHEDMKRSSNTKPADRARDIRIFHRQIWLASHNATLVEALERLMSRLHGFPGTVSIPGRWTKALKEHQALIKAIEKQDADAAGEIARKHLSDAQSARLQILARESTRT